MRSSLARNRASRASRSRAKRASVACSCALRPGKPPPDVVVPLLSRPASVPLPGAGAPGGAAWVGDGLGRGCVPEGPATGAVWVGETFGATGDDPTGAVRVGETFGAPDGGRVAPEDPPTPEGDDAEPPEGPEDAPPEDAPPPEEPPEDDPPDEEPDCASARPGIRRAAAMIGMRTACLSHEASGPDA